MKMSCVLHYSSHILRKYHVKSNKHFDPLWWKREGDQQHNPPLLLDLRASVSLVTTVDYHFTVL